MNTRKTPFPTCTAFDRNQLLASGSYLDVALAVRDHTAAHKTASVLIFDDTTGRQIDFDVRGSEAEIAARLGKQFPKADAEVRAPGRPKIGVVAREVTLLPRHWDWLADQPGGASVTLRKLVDEARRTELTDRAQLRKLQDRTYAFMSALAGNLPQFEEAARALFANKILIFRGLIAGWPEDVRDHALRLSSETV